MNLSKRLKTVADCVTPGNVVADVGTDHGYIPIYLAAHGISPHVIAMDVNEGPLSTAGRNISLNNVDNLVSTRLSDGLKELGPNEADTVIISGMGGLLTVRILKDDMDKVRSLKELILSPHSDWDVVRHFLHDEGMMITDEHMVIDDGKYYVVMKAVYRPEISRNPGECGRGAHPARALSLFLCRKIFYRGWLHCTVRCTASGVRASLRMLLARKPS